MNTLMNIVTEGNNTPKKTFVVGAVGVAENEFKGLSRIFGVTNFRSRSYKLIDVDVNSNHYYDDVDIYIVNTGNAKNIIQWHRYIESSKNIDSGNIIKFSRSEKYSDKNNYSIGMPINPIRVLKILDNYTIRELNYLPEFEIGNENAIQDKTMDNIRLLRTEQTANSNERQTKALIVDDSLAVRRQLEFEFNLLNAKSYLVKNGREAVHAASQRRFDIIFLDVVMPGPDGYATCKKIKKSEFNKNTPVILLTSRSSSFDKLKGTLAGCDAYLTKPINHNDFNATLKKHLLKGFKIRH